MRRTLIGTVTSTVRTGTLRVEIARRMKHAKYGKIIRGKTVCQVDISPGAAHIGDTVEVIECPPRSRTKRWDFVRVVAKSDLVNE